MHVPLALAFLAFLASFASAVPASNGIVRRNNGDHRTPTGSSTTVPPIRTITASCPTATASPSASDTSYVILVSNGTLAGLVPHVSGDDVTTSSSNTSVVVTLLSLEPAPDKDSIMPEATKEANLTASSGVYLISSETDDFFVLDDLGNITVNKVIDFTSLPLIPSSTTSASAPTTTSGIFGSLGDLFDDILDTVAIAIGAGALGVLILPVAVDIIIIEEVVEILEDAFGETTTVVVTLSPSTTRFIPPYPPSSPHTRSATGPEHTHSSQPGKSNAPGVWSLKPLSEESSVVVVCGGDEKAKGGEGQH